MAMQCLGTASRLVQVADNPHNSLANVKYEFSDLLYGVSKTRKGSQEFWCAEAALISRLPSLAIANQVLAQRGNAAAVARPIGCPDLQIILYCIVQLQHAKCGQPTSAQYPTCLKDNWNACPVQKNSNAQTERWIERGLNISDGCNVCATNLIEARQQAVLKLAQLPPQKKVRSFQDNKNLEHARAVLEKRLCNKFYFANETAVPTTAVERTVAAMDPAALYKKLALFDAVLQEDYMSCVKQQFQIVRKEKEEMKKCGLYLKQVLDIDSLFGSRYLVLPRENDNVKQPAAA